MPDPHPRTQADKAAPQGHVADTLHIQNFGDEVLLSLEYRLPWQVALKVLRVLKEAEVASSNRTPCSRMLRRLIGGISRPSAS
jgi:hypothetical protein